MTRKATIHQPICSLLAAAFMLHGDPSLAGDVEMQSGSLLDHPVIGVGELAPLDESRPAAPPSSCVKYQARVRYSLGYDHLVDLQNGCEKSIVCTVKTNVNPEAQQISLPAGEAATVVTYIGSPAREFTPKVSCQYR